MLIPFSSSFQTTNIYAYFIALLSHMKTSLLFTILQSLDERLNNESVINQPPSIGL